MTLQGEAKRALAELTVFAAGERALEAAAEGQQLRCDLVALDALACAFTRLAVGRQQPASLSVEQMRKVAEDLSSRLTYLLEPISPIEIDAEGCIVQLRSNPPHKEEDRTSYYELLVSRGGELSLCRYSRAARSVREAIAAHVTREVFLRLVRDFSAALASRAA